MFVRFNKSLRGDYGRARKGDVREVNADIAKKLLQRGYAVETKGPAKSGAMAKAARAAAAKTKAAQEAPPT